MGRRWGRVKEGGGGGLRFREGGGREKRRDGELRTWRRVNGGGDVGRGRGGKGEGRIEGCG